MNGDGGSIIIEPRVMREEAIRFWAEWYRGQQTSIAMFRYPQDEQSGSTGLFRELGTTTLVAIEMDGGERDGHVYWRKTKGWAVRIRFAALQWVLSHLQMFPDPAGIRECVLDGECLFDKDSVETVLKKTALKAQRVRLVPSRELFNYRIDLALWIDHLNEILARGSAPSPQPSPADGGSGGHVREGIMQLFDLYQKISDVSRRVTRAHDLARSIAPYLARSAESKSAYTAAVKALLELADDLLNRAGGKPPVEWYSPASFVHLIPPREDNKKRSTELQPDVTSCPDCERRFIENPIPHPGLPGSELILDGDPPRP